MEGQEGRGVVVCVKHPLDGPASELNDLRKGEKSDHEHSPCRVGQTHSGITAWLKLISRSRDGVVD